MFKKGRYLKTKLNKVIKH